MREKLQEIEILRAFAALAVVMIHTSATYLLPAKADNNLFLLISSFNVLGKFAVQIFIFISGVVLFYSYKDRQLKVKEFYVKRLRYIVIPYVFWTAVYVLLNKVVKGFVDKPLNYLMLFFNDLLTGQASYHLYFIVLILQFYIVFPFLHSIVKRYGFRKTVLFWLAVGYLIMITFDYYTGYVLFNSRFFIMWYFYFVLGAYVGLNMDSWRKMTIKYATIGLFFMMFVVDALTWEYFFSTKYYNFDLGIAATPLKPSVFLYTLISIIALYGLSQKIALSSGVLNKSLLFVGKYSFGLYFVHPLVLRFFASLKLTSHFEGNFALVYVLTVFTSLLLIVIFTRSKKTAVLAGCA